MTRWMARVAGAAALLSLAAGLVQAEETIRIGSDGAYPPWNLTQPDGSLAGFEIDLGNALCQRMGVTCIWVAQDWDGMIPALLGGRYNAFMAGMSINNERRQRIAFSRPYAAVPAWFVAALESPLQQTRTITEVIAALDGRTVGAQTATSHYRFLEETVPGARLRGYDTQEQLALDLAAGRIDAGLADSNAWDPFLQSNEGGAFRPFGPGLTGRDFPVFGEGVGIGLRQEDTELRARFDEAICAMANDGSLTALTNRWFGFDASMPCAR